MKEFPRDQYCYIGHLYHILQNCFKHIIAILFRDFNENATNSDISVIINAIS